MKHYYQDVEGWFSDVDAQFYNWLVRRLPDKGGRVVEVGSWKGRSLSCLLVEAKNSGKEVEIFAVDTFKGSPDFKFFDAEGNPADGPGDVELDCKKNADLANYPYKLINSTSVEAAKRFADDSLDAVFIDADHSEEAVLADIAAWEDKVRVGGIISGHDVKEAGVYRALAKRFGDGEEFTAHIIGDCWFLIRKD